MKKKRKFITVCLLFALLVGLIQSLCNTETYQAATSYTNAKEFYESTTRVDRLYHAEAAFGRVYYATQAKLAYSSTNKKYYTVGFDVTLSGNGRSVSFTVQREGGSMTQIDIQKDGGYEYILYAITEDKLFELATKANSTNAAYVLSASTINVRMDAIMTTKEGSKIKGGITENGSGGFIPWGTIYRLKDSSDLKKMKEIFSGHTFESYKEIYADLENYLLNVRYAVNGTPAISENSSTKATVNSSYRLENYTKDGVVTPYVLYNSNKTPYTSSGRTLNQIGILNPSSVGLSKTGYHLPSGNEWITASSVYFAGNRSYQAMTISPAVGYKDEDITFYANWQPNTIKINYNANGGKGTISSTETVYDKETYLSKNTFTRTGHKLKTGAEWNTKKDGTGTSYSSGQLATNMITGGEITLYANWEPCVYKITLDNQDADSAGTKQYYEKYSTGIYKESSCKNKLSKITLPTKKGYTFGGYYTSANGKGTQYVNASGTVLSKTTTFTADDTLYAYWIPNTYEIVYHPNFNGNTIRMENTQATYDRSVFLTACQYLRTGYKFIGWSTTETGAVVYEDLQSVKNLTDTDKGVVNLYAQWEPLIFNITLWQGDGSGGTENIFQQYEIGFFSKYLNGAVSNSITKVTKPSWTGHTFQGYFAYMDGTDDALIDSLGNIVMANTTFTNDATIFARYKANQYKITMDKQGGTKGIGTDSVVVTYDESVSSIECPVKGDYTFQGYYTQTGGKGTMIYNEYGSSTLARYLYTKSITVYAYWVDKTAPDVTLTVSQEEWTNEKVILTAEAGDYGSGLNSLMIYRVGSDESLTLVAQENNLNGAKTKTLTFVNTIEGIVRYKAVATDVEGNIAESFNVVYYDKTAPCGEVMEATINGTTFYFDIDITDINTRD